MSLKTPFSLNWVKYFPVHNVRCVQPLTFGRTMSALWAQIHMLLMQNCIQQRHVRTEWNRLKMVSVLHGILTIYGGFHAIWYTTAPMKAVNLMSWRHMEAVSPVCSVRYLPLLFSWFHWSFYHVRWWWWWPLFLPYTPPYIITSSPNARKPIQRKG